MGSGGKNHEMWYRYAALHDVWAKEVSNAHFPLKNQKYECECIHELFLILHKDSLAELSCIEMSCTPEGTELRPVNIVLLPATCGTERQKEQRPN